MATAPKSFDRLRRDGGDEVDHDFLDSLTDDDIERLAEADAEEHGYERESYEWIVANGRIVAPDNGDEPEPAEPATQKSSKGRDAFGAA